MEFKKKYLLIIAALLSLTSCLDNKLDESFKEINEVKRWENIEESYSVYAGEEIVLAPQVVLTIDRLNPELDFEWYVGTELVSTEPTYTFMSNKSLILSSSKIRIPSTSIISLGAIVVVSFALLCTVKS